MLWYIPRHVHSDPYTHSHISMCTNPHTFTIIRIYTQRGIFLLTCSHTLRTHAPVGYSLQKLTCMPNTSHLSLCMHQCSNIFTHTHTSRGYSYSLGVSPSSHTGAQKKNSYTLINLVIYTCNHINTYYRYSYILQPIITLHLPECSTPYTHTYTHFKNWPKMLQPVVMETEVLQMMGK